MVAAVGVLVRASTVTVTGAWTLSVRAEIGSLMSGALALGAEYGWELVAHLFCLELFAPRRWNWYSARCSIAHRGGDREREGMGLGVGYVAEC